MVCNSEAPEYEQKIYKHKIDFFSILQHYFHKMRNRESRTRDAMKVLRKHFPQLTKPSPKIQTNINKMLKYVLCIENGVHFEKGEVVNDFFGGRIVGMQWQQQHQQQQQLRITVAYTKRELTCM